MGRRHGEQIEVVVLVWVVERRQVTRVGAREVGSFPIVAVLYVLYCLAGSV